MSELLLHVLADALITAAQVHMSYGWHEPKMHRDRMTDYTRPTPSGAAWVDVRGVPAVVLCPSMGGHTYYSVEALDLGAVGRSDSLDEAISNCGYARWGRR